MRTLFVRLRLALRRRRTGYAYVTSSTYDRYVVEADKLIWLDR